MTAITEYLHWIIIAVIVLSVFLYGVFVIITILKRKIRVRDATREIALLKMDLLSKQAHLENLIEDSVEWSPRDLKEYERTLEDKKIMRSKLDTGMLIADSKVKRLELGNETYELFETLERIKKYEDKLYGEGVLDRGS
ncbi:MAG: hypothetical protein JW939_07685 [Candidatus Thermoplasmatota archaeon]|nr:hypothetical protein [Candidatus Thermoplasmatota archaeon]